MGRIKLTNVSTQKQPVPFHVGVTQSIGVLFAEPGVQPTGRELCASQTCGKDRGSSPGGTETHTHAVYSLNIFTLPNEDL